MLNTLLGRIASLLSTEFLFASFLPSLMFWFLLAATVVLVIGLDAFVEWIEAMTATRMAAISGVASVALVVFAYIMSGLRTAFTGFWSGDWNVVLWGPDEAGRFVQQLRYQRLRKRSTRQSRWADVLDTFLDGLTHVWDDKLPKPTQTELDALAVKVSRLKRGVGPDGLPASLEPIKQAFATYSGSALTPVYQAVKERLEEWDRLENAAIQRDTACLDREFGSYESIRPTALGNVIASNNHYSFKRYNIEAEIFWPRLQAVMTKAYAASVNDQRALFDFYVASATLLMVYAGLALLAGPWLWPNFLLWMYVATGGALVAYTFYRLAIAAAVQFGELVRASFDLFRLDLMAMLARPHPDTFATERRQWAELSALAVYGVVTNFALRPRTADAESDEEA